MSPDDVEVGQGVCLKHDRNQPFAQCLNICEQLLSCGIRWSMLKRIIHICWPLATFGSSGGLGCGEDG